MVTFMERVPLEDGAHAPHTVMQRASWHDFSYDAPLCDSLILEIALKHHVVHTALGWPASHGLLSHHPYSDLRGAPE